MQTKEFYELQERAELYEEALEENHERIAELEAQLAKAEAERDAARARIAELENNNAWFEGHQFTAKEFGYLRTAVAKILADFEHDARMDTDNKLSDAFHETFNNWNNLMHNILIMQEDALKARPADAGKEG